MRRSTLALALWYLVFFDSRGVVEHAVRFVDKASCTKWRVEKKNKGGTMLPGRDIITGRKDVYFSWGAERSRCVKGPL